MKDDFHRLGQENVAGDNRFRSSGVATYLNRRLGCPSLPLHFFLLRRLSSLLLLLLAVTETHGSPLLHWLLHLLLLLLLSQIPVTRFRGDRRGCLCGSGGKSPAFTGGSGAKEGCPRDGDLANAASLSSIILPICSISVSSLDWVIESTTVLSPLPSEESVRRPATFLALVTGGEVGDFIPAFGNDTAIPSFFAGAAGETSREGPASQFLF